MIDWQIESNIDILLPPLTIQPLVENAVKHGILQLAKGRTICIRIKKQSNRVDVSVIDNGKGMTEVELEQLFNEKVSQGRTSVGLRNGLLS